MKITRSPVVITPDRTRVLIRPFQAATDEGSKRIVDNLLALEERKVVELYNSVLQGFAKRHIDISAIMLDRFAQMSDRLAIAGDLSIERKALIGSYFMMEYSPESAALFNPSIVPHPDQSGIAAGSLRFILSLRATGEGHISSIAFRTGVLDNRNSVHLDESVPYTLQATRKPNRGYEKGLFSRKLREVGVHDEFSKRVLDSLPDVFIFDELRDAIQFERGRCSAVDIQVDRSSQAIILLAESNYEVVFGGESELSQRILFPSGPSQSNGIEDARFVRFVDDDETVTYYATYTAYDGKITLPQLLETRDFTDFKFATLNGTAVRNKGMALFPRKIDGKYAMLSRQDDENIFLMYSDNVHFWYDPAPLLSPAEPWEYMKIGTCGSPIETDAGWLVISHGVGAIRKYSIGAFLLDKEDPSIVIGRLSEPLVVPLEDERDGYVPNVVYTCGALIHGNDLVLPYAVSDYATKFATVNLNSLIRAMTR